jgi:hypothetical protein
MTPKNRDKQEGAQFVRCFGPLLDALRELGGSGTPDEVAERIADALHLSDEVQNEHLPSGEPRYRNQVAWARFYLFREGLIDSSNRGIWSLTERGRATTLSPEQAREIFLKWVRIFQEQRRAKTLMSEPIAEQVAEGTGAARDDYRGEVIEVAPLGFRATISAPLARGGVRPGCSYWQERRRWNRRSRHTPNQPVSLSEGALSMQTLRESGVAVARPGFPRRNGWAHG